MRRLRKGLPLLRNNELQAPVRERLQGQGYLHERDKGGKDRQRKVHLLRRLRISVSLRSHIRQIIHPERHRSDKKERREQGIQGIRRCCAFYLKPVYLCKARSGHNGDKGSRLPHRC